MPDYTTQKEININVTTSMTAVLVKNTTGLFISGVNRKNGISVVIRDIFENAKLFNDPYSAEKYMKKFGIKEDDYVITRLIISYDSKIVR